LELNKSLEGLPTQGGDSAVLEMKEKFSELEKAVAEGKVDVSQPKNGGVWLNDLRAFKSPVSYPPLNGATIEGKYSDMKIPDALPGWEEAIAKLSEKNGSIESGAGSEYLENSLLISHRGYQLKALENAEKSNEEKIRTIQARLTEIGNKEGK